MNKLNIFTIELPLKFAQKDAYFSNYVKYNLDILRAYTIYLKNQEICVLLPWMNK